MRKVNKRKAFLAELLALTMLLCSFHVITAEAMDTDFVPAEETVTTELVPEETAGPKKPAKPEKSKKGGKYARNKKDKTK